MVERNDLSVDDAIGQPASRFGNGGKLCSPVEALARAHHGLAALHAQLHAVAVELDLMNPVRPDGGRLTLLQSCGGMKPGMAAAPLARGVGVLPSGKAQELLSERRSFRGLSARPHSP